MVTIGKEPFPLAARARVVWRAEPGGGNGPGVGLAFAADSERIHNQIDRIFFRLLDLCLRADDDEPALAEQSGRR